MTKAKHQPGPWSIKGYTLFSGETVVGSVVDANGETVRLTGVALSGGPVCEANARLIAAAPELLAALKECADLIVGINGRDSWHYQQAMAAIAKAEGQS